MAALCVEACTGYRLLRVTLSSLILQVTHLNNPRWVCTCQKCEASTQSQQTCFQGSCTTCGMALPMIETWTGTMLRCNTWRHGRPNLATKSASVMSTTQCLSPLEFIHPVAYSISVSTASDLALSRQVGMCPRTNMHSCILRFGSFHAVGDIQKHV